MTDHVYIAIRGGLTKVGIAVNPVRRIRQQRAEMFWCSVPCEGAGWVGGPWVCETRKEAQRRADLLNAKVVA
jgi:hypothetical protein